ncbi:hypothetical protein P9J64_15190 [Deltaproteobacteria bacterium IMCC39524]|nr:hypothetical protein [Deltaproteobacteria bacterium IMCC39524]
MLLGIKKIFLWCFSRVPIIGNLTKTSFKAQKEATIEMVLTLIFSTLPIWFSGLRVASNKYYKLLDLPEKNRPAEINFLEIYWSAIIDAISNAELLMYSAALLGPTLYLAFKSFIQKREPFPWVRPQIIFAVLINFIAADLFFASRENHYSAEPSFLIVTLCFYSASLLILFPAMAYEHDRILLDPSREQRTEQKSYQRSYKTHRGQ